MAAQEGHGNVVQALQENNANLNQATKPCGKNLVYMAAIKGHLDVVKMLLEHDANPDLANTIDGATPVYAVVDQGYLECLKVLLEHGANPNQATTSTGSSSLHACSSFQGLSDAQLLAVHGANIAAVNFEGNAPSFYAIRYGHHSLADWLDAVIAWSPMRVAAALRMHSCITFLLQQGRIDPDDRVTFPATEIVAAIAASSAAPAALPWESALHTCQTAIKLVISASFGWKYSTHQLYHANVKSAVFAVLAVADRLQPGRRADAAEAASGLAPLPLLPPELWLLILHFFQRSWWRVL